METKEQTPTIKIGNFKLNYLRTFTDTYTNKTYIDYEYIFNNTDQLTRFYRLCKKNAFMTNFGGNPFESNSFIEIKNKNGLLTVNAPVALNGDNNWYKYSNNSKKSCNICLQLI